MFSFSRSFCNIIGVCEADPKLANNCKKALGDRNYLEGALISLEAQGQLVGAGREECKYNATEVLFCQKE